MDCILNTPAQKSRSNLEPAQARQKREQTLKNCKQVKYNVRICHATPFTIHVNNEKSIC